MPTMSRFARYRASVAARTLTVSSGTAAIPPFVAALTAEVRTELARALRDAASADNEQALLDAVRAVLATEEWDGEPVAVLFQTMDFDDGWFLVEHGAAVYFADGSVDDRIEFNRDVAHLLTKEFGACGRTTTALVDLRTGAIDVDDYRHDPHGELGLNRASGNADVH